MAVPIPVAYVKAAPTFFKGTRSSDASETTTSTSYVDIPNMPEILSVPDNAKILSSIRLQKATAGDALLRLTDGTNTFKEYTVAVGAADTTPEDLDGSTLQNSGGAATVKMQFKSSEGSVATTLPNRNTILVTDGDVPMVIRGPLPQSVDRLPMKVSIAKLFIFRSSNEGTTEDMTNINGVLAFKEDVSTDTIYDSEITFTYPNETILNYFEILTENNLIAGEWIAFDWSGNGASFA